MTRALLQPFLRSCVIAVLTLAATTLATPTLPASRPTGILMLYDDGQGAVKPALFSMPGYDMSMSECRRAMPEQVSVLKASLRSDRDYFDLTLIDAACVYLDAVEQ
jgi:hypothetical protein